MTQTRRRRSIGAGSASMAASGRSCYLLLLVVAAAALLLTAAAAVGSACAFSPPPTVAVPPAAETTAEALRQPRGWQSRRYGRPATGTRTRRRRGFAGSGLEMTAAAIPTKQPSSAFDGASKQQQPKVGVLLLNLGGPETGDDVEGTTREPPLPARTLMESVRALFPVW